MKLQREGTTAMDIVEKSLVRITSISSLRIQLN